MRKFCMFLMVASLLFLSLQGAIAEQTAETLLYAPLEEGEETARVIGVASDPLPRTYESFLQRYTYFMEHNFQVTPAFAGPYFSDGAWTYVVTEDASTVLVRASGSTPDALIREIRLVGAPDEAYGLLVLAAGMYNSAAKCGTAGQAAMNQLYLEAEPERYFDFPTEYWVENGFRLSFGGNDLGLPMANILYTEPVETAVPASFDWENPPTILNGPALHALNAYLTDHAGTFLLTAPNGEVTQDEKDEFTDVYAFQWEDCMVSIEVSKGSGAVEKILITTDSEETDSLWNRALLLFLAAAQVPDADVNPILNLTGGAGSWETLSALEPFAYLNQTALKCLTEEGEGGSAAYSALIAGAIESVVAE